MDAVTEQIIQELYDYTQVSEAIATQTGQAITWTAEEWNAMSITEQYNAMTSLGYSALRNPNTDVLGWYKVTGAEAQAYQEYTIGRTAWEEIQGASSISAAKNIEGTGIAVQEVVKDANTGAVTAQSVRQTTTASGATIQAGGTLTALKVANTALLVAMVGGAVARDYKQHTDFWNDLGDAVLQKGEFTGINLGGTMPTAPSDWNGVDAGIDVVRVIGRRVTDFYGISNYYTYLSENDIACIMMELNAQGAFAPGEIEYDEVHEGYMTTVSGGVDGHYAHKIASKWNLNNSLDLGVTINGSMVSQAVGIASRLAPIDADTIFAQPSGRIGEASIAVWAFKSPPMSHLAEDEDCSSGYRVDNFSSIEAGWAMVTIDSQHRTTVQSGVREIGATTVPVGIYESSSSVMSISSLFATYVEGGLPEQGLTPDEYADLFTAAAGASLAEIIDAIRNQYPDWYGESFETSNYNPNTGLFDKERWYPVSIPWNNPNEEPYNIPDGYNQGYGQSGKPFPNPQTTPTGIGTPYPYPWGAPYLPSFPTTVFPDVPPSPTPTPQTPSVPPAVTGSSNALWAVYNPTFSEVTALGQYLWSSSIIDIIQKFFSNPMDAIISLHMIYTTPSTGASQNIKLGYLDSGVSAKIVTNQYKYIDCGTITVPEYFQDVRDYSPYTKVDVYLPFIGVRSIAPEDVIGCSLRIKYSVDVLTGAILCELYVTKRGSTQCLYTFAGNASVQIPLTGGDRTRLLSGVISGVGTIAGGAMVGGIGGGVVAGTHAISGLHQTSQVERSGNFSANAGAMGIKTPYIIINRKDAYDAYNYPSMHGLPSNNNVQLSSCRGYTRVKDVHLNSVPATQAEKIEIERLLKEGFVIN